MITFVNLDDHCSNNSSKILDDHFYFFFKLDDHFGKIRWSFNKNSPKNERQISILIKYLKGTNK